MKVLVAIAAYGITGVPLTQIKFARALARRGFSVDLMIGHIPEGYTFVPPEGLDTIVLDEPKARGMFISLTRYLRSRKPDIVFSAEDHLNTIVLMAAVITRSKAKISGSCRVTPFDTYSNKVLSKRWFLKQFASLLMNRADAMTCVSAGMVEEYRTIFKSPPHVRVYNMVWDAHSEEQMREPVDHPWLLDKAEPVLIAAGRLAPWKGFTDLIQAAAILKKHRPFKLIILGDGPQRSELSRLVQDLGLSDQVYLHGYVSNPLKYFARADVFVLSSLSEGLGNVLVEALMAGCTVVSNDCPTGPREVLQGGRFGYLVPVGDHQAMADAISGALDNPMDPALRSEAVSRFREDTIIEQHFSLLGLEPNADRDLQQGILDTHSQ